MKRKVIIAIVYMAVVAVCYGLTFYIHPLLGLIGIGLGINTLDELFCRG